MCIRDRNQTDQDDSKFLKNAKECERLGIPYGVYIYSYATNTSRADSEADHVLRLLKGRTLSYPVYFDMEDSSTLAYKSSFGKIAETFCNKINACLLYTSSKEFISGFCRRGRDTESI